MKLPNRDVSRILALFIAFTLFGSPLTLLPAYPAHAYVSSLGNLISSSITGDTLTLTVDNGAEPSDDLLIVQAVQNGILKVDYRPSGIAASAKTPMLDPNKTWSAVGATINTAANPMTITTSNMKIEITKNPVRMTVKKADGTTLFWEPSGGGVFSDGVRFVHGYRWIICMVSGASTLLIAGAICCGIRPVMPLMQENRGIPVAHLFGVRRVTEC